jgi:hypothetical protein
MKHLEVSSENLLSYSYRLIVIEGQQNVVILNFANMIETGGG